MPGEEGYPTYLGNRLGKFYERAGRVRAAGAPDRDGSLTVISAISPPGGDFSEPVTQAALRVTGALWALDATLAHQRQFPAVDWETSYSLYAEVTAPWLAEHAGTDWSALRRETLELLQRDRELREIAELVGPDALLDVDRLLLEVAALVREAVLGQSAYDPNDAHSSLEKTHRLATLALAVHRAGRVALERGVTFEQLDLATVRRHLMALRRAGPADIPARASEVQAALEALSP
jgi:V/A-type H+-transporting ATPase subunit A